MQSLVIGGGPAGLAAALALAQCKVATCVLAPPHRPNSGQTDTRTAALFAGSITLLRNLGVWNSCAAASAPVGAIRIVDDTGAWPRAPEVLFTAAEASMEAFGYNVPNTALVEALLDATRRHPAIATPVTDGVASITVRDGLVEATTREGLCHAAPLVVAADGRNSLCRQAVGIGVRSWSYDQAAVTAQFEHSRGHDGISTELHRGSGPLTVVPMPGAASSLVWVERPQAAAELARLDDAQFRVALEARLRGLLGRIGGIGPRAVFPLKGMSANALGRDRVALTGEAGHVIPPIGAQGLNLGLRDAASIAELAGDAAAAGEDIGGADVLARYGRARAADVGSRTWTIDLLNRSLLSPLLPVHLLRGLGLAVLKSMAPIRRVAVREGLQPSWDVPRLMRDAPAANVGDGAAG